MRRFRRRPRLVMVRCWSCKRRMQAVKGSAIALDPLCNFCVYRDVNGYGRTMVGPGRGPLT